MCTYDQELCNVMRNIWITLHEGNILEPYACSEICTFLEEVENIEARGTYISLCQLCLVSPTPPFPLPASIILPFANCALVPTACPFTIQAVDNICLAATKIGEMLDNFILLEHRNGCSFD